MKILYLCPDRGIPVLGRKGASVHVRELASALARSDHRVTLVAQVLNKIPGEKPAPFDVPVVQVAPPDRSRFAGASEILYDKKLVEEVKRRFEKDRPDFIYERASFHASAGASLARHFKVPLVLEVNAPIALEQATYRTAPIGDFARQAEQRALSHADLVLVVSSELRRHVVGLGIEGTKVHVVPNGVNPSLFRPGKPGRAAARRWKLNGGPVLGFVGSLRPWHGVEILPDLLSRLSKRHRDLRLVIAGDGQMRDELERGFKKRGLERRVLFTGPMLHEEVPGIVRHFTVGLAPYPKANHDFYFSPLKVFEYMACGVPIVAADLGQIAEVVADCKTGLLYPAGNLDALVERCETLLASPALRRKIGQAAARCVRREFTWNRNARRIIQLVRPLLKKRRK